MTSSIWRPTVRNLAIEAMRARGETYRSIGRSFRISGGRAHQVCDDYRRYARSRAMPRVQLAIERLCPLLWRATPEQVEAALAAIEARAAAGSLPWR